MLKRKIRFCFRIKSDDFCVENESCRVHMFLDERQEFFELVGNVFKSSREQDYFFPVTVNLHPKAIKFVVAECRQPCCLCCFSAVFCFDCEHDIEGSSWFEANLLQTLESLFV